MTAKSETGNIAETLPVEFTEKTSLLGRIGIFLKKIPEGELISPQSTPVELQKSVRIAWDGQPFQLKLGKVTLEFHPDLSITGDINEDNREWIVHAGGEFYKNVPIFIRIRPGEEILLGRNNDLCKEIFGFNKSVAGRHVNILNHKGELTIQPLDIDRSTEISAIASPTAVWKERRKNLMRLERVLGHPLTQFGDKEALGIIRKVNAIIAAEVYRELDGEGSPGGIIQFPDDMTVVILGDIHTRADNVLRVITEGGMLRALERGKACLVFLGDLVHSQETDELEDMESSVFMLDLFSMLKCRFPKNVFYIRGNHESFSPDVGKGGVPQGVLLHKLLKDRRGKAYVTEIETLFGGLAFVVQGNGFAACHGAPVRSRVDRDTLVNIRRYPGIQYELVWNRLRQGNRPAGYGKGSVKRFRQTLNLAKHAPVIVAHTPLSSDDTVWLDIGGIAGHHVVYSAHTHRVAALRISGGQLTPLEFVPEPALAFLNDGQNQL